MSKTVKIVTIGRAKFRFTIVRFTSGKLNVLFSRLYSDGSQRFGYFGNQPTVKQAFLMAKQDLQIFG